MSNEGQSGGRRWGGYLPVFRYIAKYLIMGINNTYIYIIFVGEITPTKAKKEIYNLLFPEVRKLILKIVE